MRYLGRLIAGTVAVLLVTVLALVILADRSLRRELEGDLAGTLTRQAAMVREALPNDSAQWATVALTLATSAGIRITVIDSNGRVRADTDIPPQDLALTENHLDRPEVRSALERGQGSAKRHSASVGRDFLYVALPGGPGVVRLAMSLDQVGTTVRRAQRTVLIAALLALIPGCLLAWLAARAIARPLMETADAARIIASGGAPRFPHSTIPDVNAMVTALRNMHEELDSRFLALRRKHVETEAMVNAMVEGVVSCDGSGRVVTANPAARRLLGYNTEHQIPELPLLFRQKEAREAVASALRGATLPDREVDLDGRTCLISARPLPDGGAVVVLHDLTEVRKLETIRRDFVANVSHELKTPLTSIAGYAETLLGQRPDAATARGFLETILQNTRRMQDLVDDQLDLSRIESGQWRPSPQPVLLRSAFEEAWGTGSEPRGLSFRVEVAPDAETLVVDREALRQILANLYDNARRHTPPDGWVTARSVRDGDAIVVTVQDTGTGIAGEHLPRIFERFYRADPSRSRAGGGTGLGLAIVKHLVEAHGGRTWAASTLGGGTTIFCWFPTRESAA